MERGIVQMYPSADGIVAVLEGGDTVTLPVFNAYFWVRKKERKVAEFWLKKYGIEGSVVDETKKTLPNSNGEEEEVVRVEVEDPDSRYVLSSVLETWESDVDYLLQYRLDFDFRTGRNYRTIFFDCEWIKKDQDYLLKVIATNEKVYVGKEDDILSEFFRDLGKYDLAVGYGIEDYDIPVLKNINRRYGFTFPKCHFFDWEIFFENWGGQRQLPSYKLGYVSEVILGRKRKYSGSVTVLSDDELVERAMDDVDILLQLEEKVGALRIAIAQASYTYLFPEDTYFVGRPLESLLLKKAHSMGYVLNNRRKGEKVKHSGAFVMKPPAKWKIFENVAYVDVKSLYPNVIIRYRISPDKEKRLLPELEEELVRERAKVKGKDEAMSEALKLLANAVYGYLSYANSRLFYPHLGDEVATRGREVVTKMVEFFRSKGFETIYADTDSVFVVVGSKEMLNLEEVSNALGFEVDLKRFFKKIFFLGKGRTEDDEVAKKRYIGLDEQDKIVIVGAERIRSDVPPIVQELQETVARMYLEGKSKEEIKNFVKEFKEVMVYLPAEKYVIRKGLRKDPNNYKSIPPHVQVYQKIKEKFTLEEDKIPFVWVKVGAKTKSVVPEFYLPDRQYAIAVDYYWEHYIAPTLLRTLGIKLKE